MPGVLSSSLSVAVKQNTELAGFHLEVTHVKIAGMIDESMDKEAMKAPCTAMGI